MLKVPIVLDLSTPAKLAALKGSSVTIKEGVEYSVELEFKVSGGLCSGLKYLQVAKRSGIKVDKIEHMIGSFGPSPDPVVKRFPAEEAPSGDHMRSCIVVPLSTEADSLSHRHARSRIVYCKDATGG
jgi:Rho GDP-dissociation inhibitor